MSLCMRNMRMLVQITSNFELDKPSFEDGISLLNLCIDMRTPIPTYT